MVSKWSSWALHELDISFEDGDRSGRYPKSHEFLDYGNHPFLNTKNIVDGRLDLSEINFLSDQKFSEIKKGRVKLNDIIISTRGSQLGKVAFYREHQWSQPLINAQLLIIRVKDKRLVPEYLYLLLNSTDGKKQIEMLKSGSAQPQLPVRDLKKFIVDLPDVMLQKKILRLNNSLDNKIILNRKINQTLEQMALALFKSWFVDFDPVVDNALDAGFFEQDLEFSDELLHRAEARKAVRESASFKMLPDAIRQLFPAAFDESAETSLGLGGWIPKGWRSGELGDVLLLRNERTKPSSETKNIPYVPIECIGTKEPLLSESKSGEEANSSLVLFKKGDILFGAMRPYFHKVCLAPFNGVTRSTVFTLTAKNLESIYFSLFLAYQESTVEYATLHSEGSTIPYAKWKGSLERKPIVVPTIELQQLFHQRVESFIEWGNSSNEQSKSLLKLRDTLLPKLISGELRIDEIEAELASERLA
jgi:type I restriction enzyme S subunit